jgi:hypothetical protein
MEEKKVNMKLALFLKQMSKNKNLDAEGFVCIQ